MANMAAFDSDMAVIDMAATGCAVDGLSEVIQLMDVIFSHLPGPSKCFNVVSRIGLFGMKVKQIESPPLQPGAIAPRRAKKHRFHDVWSVLGSQSLSSGRFQF